MIWAASDPITYYGIHYRRGPEWARNFDQPPIVVRMLAHGLRCGVVAPVQDQDCGARFASHADFQLQCLHSMLYYFDSRYFHNTSLTPDTSKKHINLH